MYYTYVAKSAVKKRTYNLDGQLIARARVVTGARTDTEAIQLALRKTIEDAELEHALDALLRQGRFKKIYS
jgi:Arc/MetJ family transcription regulator